MSAILTLEHLERYNANPIHFTIFPGTIVQITGNDSNAAIDAIAQLDSKSIAKHLILYNRVPVSKAINTYRTQILYLSLNVSADQELTLKQSINFWCNIHNCPDHKDFALCTFNMENKQHRLLKNLSITDKKKALLSRLVMSHAPIWLLVSPFEHLDAESIAILEMLIESRRQQNGIIIFSSQSKKKLQHCDSIITL